MSEIYRKERKSRKLARERTTLYKWRTQVSPTSKYDEPDVENVAWGLSPSATFSTKGRHIWMSHERPCFICFVVWPTISLKYVFWLIFNFYQQSVERSCARSTPFGRWRCNIQRLHSNKLKRHLANPIIWHFHVTAFRPISEAARSWSGDKLLCSVVHTFVKSSADYCSATLYDNCTSSC